MRCGKSSRSLNKSAKDAHGTSGERPHACGVPARALGANRVAVCVGARWAECTRVRRWTRGWEWGTRVDAESRTLARCSAWPSWIVGSFVSYARSAHTRRHEVVGRWVGGGEINNHATDELGIGHATRPWERGVASGINGSVLIRIGLGSDCHAVAGCSSAVLVPCCQTSKRDCRRCWR